MNTRKHKLKTLMVFNYYKCISEMHNQITTKDKAYLDNICKSFVVAKGISAVMQEQKIIQKISRGKYNWIGNKPTLDMAENIIEILRAKANYYDKRYKEKVNAPEVKIVNKTTNKSFSLFWGLIKFNLQYVN